MRSSLDPHQCLLGAALLVLTTGAASAQSWVPPKGEGLISLEVQYLDAGKHLFSGPTALSGTDELDIGTTESQVLALRSDVGITDQIAVSASVTYIQARYSAGGLADSFNDPHTGEEIDDGSWNGSLQDARIGVRYMQPIGTWVLTPSLGVVFPLSSYPTVGHAARGTGLKELQLGLEGGRAFFGSRRATGYFQGRYRYAFIEDLPEVSLDRSHLMLEIGYFLRPRVTLRAFSTWVDTHGGIDWLKDLNADTFHGHDRTSATRALRAGLGLSVPLTLDSDLFVSVTTTIDGENTHDATAITTGVSWGLSVPGFGQTRIRTPD
jgi:hypothetical protein